MCWLVYRLNCSPQGAVLCLKKATGTLRLPPHSDNNKREMKSDMSAKNAKIRLEVIMQNGSSYVISIISYHLFTLTNNWIIRLTIWSFWSSFRACLFPGSSFNTSWKSVKHTNTNTHTQINSQYLIA